MGEVYTMVMPLLSMALAAGVVVCGLTALAEWLHARRVRRVAHLAFGRGGRGRVWTAIVPPARAVGAGLVAFGLVVLGVQEPEAVEARPTAEASKHLLVCLDASPSMFVEDAGPRGDQKRAIWAGELVQGILDRLDTETTRVTVFAVYTKALPVIEQTFDTHVVRNLLDGLPLYAAFAPGATKLSSGVSEALEYARQWERDSATLVVISDGDSEDRTPIRHVPSSIADALVIGVGDPIRPTMISGHRSRQDSASLRTLAAKLGGMFHDGNAKHLPSDVLAGLRMITPRVSDSVGLREAGMAAVGFGSGVVVAAGPVLVVFGRRRAERTLGRATATGNRVAAAV